VKAAAASAVVLMAQVAAVHISFEVKVQLLGA